MTAEPSSRGWRSRCGRWLQESRLRVFVFTGGMFAVWMTGFAVVDGASPARLVFGFVFFVRHIRRSLGVPAPRQRPSQIRNRQLTEVLGHPGLDAPRHLLLENEVGATVVLYVGDDFEDVYPVRESMGRPLWHRRFLRRPNVDRWLIWQVTGWAHVEGVKGDVDLNVMRSPR